MVLACSPSPSRGRRPAPPAPDLNPALARQRLTGNFAIAVRQRIFESLKLLSAHHLHVVDALLRRDDAGAACRRHRRRRRCSRQADLPAVALGLDPPPARRPLEVRSAAPDFLSNVLTTARRPDGANAERWLHPQSLLGPKCSAAGSLGGTPEEQGQTLSQGTV